MRLASGILTGRALREFLILAIVVRLVRDVGVRMMYPYLPAYARGVGLTITALGTLLAFRAIMLVFAPYFGHLADRTGSRRWLLGGYVVLAAGMMLFSLAHGYVWTAAALLLLGLSDAIVTPLMQAYVSEHSPARVRGRALATVEYSWAITGILFMPLVGWMIDDQGWQTPFRVVALAALLSALLMWVRMPRDKRTAAPGQMSMRLEVKDIFRDRSALAAVLVNAVAFIAVETFFLVWGAHLELSYAQNPAWIGRVALLIGLAELSGAVLSSLVIDKVGKRRGTLAGVLAFATIMALMPLFDQALLTLVIGLVLASLFLEYSIVSLIPLLGQQRPGGRATMFAVAVMAAALSRSATDAAAAWLLENLGFLAAMTYALLALLVAAWLLWRWVEERAETTEMAT
ncbi:MAG: MFS transporter [Chloroflexi bacterium]|nr:MFS transporter [Chloroflexota bacterium]